MVDLLPRIEQNQISQHVGKEMGKELYKVREEFPSEINTKTGETYTKLEIVILSQVPVLHYDGC